MVTGFLALLYFFLVFMGVGRAAAPIEDKVLSGPLPIKSLACPMTHHAAIDRKTRL